ncbi:MAG TPA: histidine kinase [Chitinophaga sp.]|uniref:sensor histidine kinase n=1 Tax=Chitinophaga sp. TaxID=1869181 RepID=UPI002B97E13D|nr:histidine kinase [Chitinophaga sp.]HVI46513.1 histidine kinase [Chitinophaga sp.]
MLTINTRISVTRLQWLVWLFVLLLLFLSLLPEDGFMQSACYATINLLTYATIIYGNISFLYPRLYLRGRRVSYVIVSVLFLVMVGMGRGYLSAFVYNHFFAPKPVPVTVMMLARNMVGILLIYLLSFIFRIAIAYFTLKQQAEKLVMQQAQTELNLLKSQVQPHFLFNTLNNIYYEAYREAPRTAFLIERLSEIMRYFVDESQKDIVNISAEINFLENYIALEKIRIRHEVGINFRKQVKEDCRIPPMLLMTFVENIFKHGIDKSSTLNQIDISLKEENNQLIFTTKNSLPEQANSHRSGGSGIDNLRKRLDLLYGKNYELKTEKTAAFFTAFLTVPL